MSNTGTAPPTRRTAVARFVSLLLATVAAVAVWFVADSLLDIGLRAKTGGDKAQEIGVASVIGATVVVGLLGWGLLAVLDRATASARTVWTVIASVVLLLSLLGPVGAEGTSAKAALAVMHLVVGLILIPGYARTARKG
ncbi:MULTISPECIES: DUF6069 family protein [unclassified Streptomyces]|uniref:DUF6069 family protein n=1 Tax=unclassified Streptomyces TaxID=2593676 RepID=UPI0033B04EF3